MTLWSGRFDSEPDEAAFQFGASFGFDRRLFEDDVTGSRAWARALAAAGVLSRDEASAIDRALASILEHGREDPAAFDLNQDEDVHSFVERLLVERLGTRGAACTQAARGTSRSRSTCGSTSCGAFRCCSALLPGWWRRSPRRPVGQATP